jgi:hypothetical protein
VNLKWISWIALVPLSLVGGLRSQQVAPDPFAILKPEIAINPDDQQTLDAREVVLKVLPAEDHELAVLAAGALNASSTKLTDKINNIVALKRSAAVPEIGRFSSPPVLGDLAALTLDSDDVDAIHDCRSGDCPLKLSPREINELHDAANGKSGEASTEAINQEFRRIVLERVNAYLERGLAGIPDYATGHSQVKLPVAFATLLQHSAFVREKAPQLAAYLAHYPDTPSPTTMTSSFLYWSKEKYAWKSIISVTHVTIVNPGGDDRAPELVVTSKEVFATRYTSGGLVLALLLRGDGRAPHYLVYINRAWVDALHGFWRPFINHHIRSEARRVFAAARTRIEAARDGD